MNYKFYLSTYDLLKFSAICVFREYLKKNNFVVKELEEKQYDEKFEKIIRDEKFVCFLSGCVGEGSTTKPRSVFYRLFRKYNKPVIVFDRNFFIFNNKNKNIELSFRIQFDSLYENEATQLFDEFTENRWEKIKNRLNINLKEWRKSGDHIIVMINNTFGNMNSEENLKKYYNNLLINIRKHSNRKILLFTHLNEKREYENFQNTINFKNISNCEFYYKKDFTEYLKNCWCFVTRNSSSSLCAVINGIPIFVDENSKPFTEKLANFNIENIENPLMPEREPLLNMLAHRIWFLDECEIYHAQILKVLKDKYFK